jgi:hypothetical protein
MRKKPVQIFIASLATLSLIGLAAPAQAAPPNPKNYANCAALNKVYPHGVARKGGKDKEARESRSPRSWWTRPRTTSTRRATATRMASPARNADLNAPLTPHGDPQRVGDGLAACTL